jgi:hypothetical protein
LSVISDKLAELYPEGLHGVRIGIDACHEPARVLVVSLFLKGATIYAASEVPNDIGLLNRDMFERSNSLHRYKPVSLSSLSLEKLDVLISLRGTKNDNAKHVLGAAAPKPPASTSGENGQKS